MRYIGLLCTLLILLTVSGPATGQTAGRLYLRGCIGVGTQSLGDVNKAIEDDEQVFQGLGIPVDFETFGSAFDLAGELGIWLNSTVSVGVWVSHQSNKVDYVYSDITGALSDELNLRVIDVSGNMTFWSQTAPRWFFGANAGVGFGFADESFVVRDFTNPSNTLRIEGKWDGNGFVGGAFAGLQYDFPAGPLLFAMIGYHYRNLGEFDGEMVVGSNRISVPAQDNAGQPLNFDFSGMYARIGLGISFGS